MPENPLHLLLNPKSIAVAGAGNNPLKMGTLQALAILKDGYTGKFYPVHPTQEAVLGIPCFPDVASLPRVPELAIVCTPAEQVPAAVTACGEAGILGLIVMSAGFRETGEAGRALEQEVRAAHARFPGMRILGPNCLGVINPLPQVSMNASFSARMPNPGNISFISQSGAIITTIVDWSLPADFGFSTVISVGNQADLGFEHYLRFAEQDEMTRSITLYIEEILDGRRFMEIVREITPRKPVVAVKSGSSRKGQATASSHTGSLAGSYEVYIAAFRQTGVIPARSLRDAFNLAELLASEGYPRGNRAIAVTSAGGFAVLASDYAEAYGVDMVEIPEEVLQELNAFLPPYWNHTNPMDILGDADATRFAALFDVLIRHQEFWDIAFAIAVPTTTVDPTHVANEIVRFSRNTSKMVVGCMLGGDSIKSGLRILRGARIPNFEELEDAFKAVGNILDGRMVRER